MSRSHCSDCTSSKHLRRSGVHAELDTLVEVVPHECSIRQLREATEDLTAYACI